MFLIEISLLPFLISGTELNDKERGTLGGQGDQRGPYYPLWSPFPPNAPLEIDYYANLN